VTSTRTALDIEEHANDHGDVVLKLSGELDDASVRAFERAAERVLVMTEEGAVLTLDLSALMFIDSVGLAAVVLINRLCERDGRVFQIVPGPRSVQRLFEITGLVDVLPFTAVVPRAG
jgi:anti-sigma B factor antagonist